jgi:hypothetical protein
MHPQRQRLLPEIKRASCNAKRRCTLARISLREKYSYPVRNANADHAVM